MAQIIDKLKNDENNVNDAPPLAGQPDDVPTDATADQADDGTATDDDPTADAPATETATDDAGTSDDETDSGTDTFSRTYVEKLRRENATYREKARTAEHYAARLHEALVSATGKLADPTDLPFDADHLDDPDALAAAIDELLSKKPHLASRKPFGDVGQGNRGGTVEPVNLADMLRARA